jgi:single-strand DNA-binding protein
MYLNKVLLYGNVTKDPEVKALPSGSNVAQFSLATNRTYKDKNGVKQEQADFHNIVVFGNSANLIAQYVKKGSGLFVEGRIQTRSWDGADGKKNYRTEIVCDSFQFGPRPAGAGVSTGGASYSAAKPSASAAMPAAKKGGEDAPMEEIQYPEEQINAEDIPF